jgi:hypothetical protein
VLHLLSVALSYECEYEYEYEYTSIRVNEYECVPEMCAVNRGHFIFCGVSQ